MRPSNYSTILNNKSISFELNPQNLMTFLNYKLLTNPELLTSYSLNLFINVSSSPLIIHLIL
jgi:hypothetical protein